MLKKTNKGTKMNIITISREFGSGGRELGKRLSELLNYDYYDKEIITEIAKRHNVDEDYVENALNNHVVQTYSLSFHHSFVSPMYINTPDVNILREQRLVIEEIAGQNKNCIIVGRNADVLLSDKNPLNLFICADMDAKVKRCRERATDDEKSFSDKQFKKMIKRIDKNRARTRYLIADGEWGNRHSYHLIINTTDWDIEQLAKALAEFVKRWYNEQ